MSHKEHKAGKGEEGIAPFGGPTTAPAKDASGVKVREQSGSLIYSAHGVDMIERKPGAASYKCLRDFPKWGYAAGDVKTLTDGSDEQCACTARDLADSLTG